jgi:molecular chaperone DnaK
MAKDNKSLGRFHLQGIPPAPARVPQIEVTFDIDANGILNVSAVDKGTNQRQSITISGSGNLSREEIDRMMKEAEANAEADARAQELAELKNKSDQLCYSTEKTIRELGDRISEGEKQRIEEKVANLRKAVAADDEAEMRTAFSLLETESHQLAEQLYKQASDSADASEVREPAGTGARGGSSDDDVIDAEFKEDK